MLKQNSAGRLSTTESDESFKTMKPPSKKNYPKFIGLSHSHFFEYEDSQKKGITEMVKTHINFDTWNRTRSGISGIF